MSAGWRRASWVLAIAALLGMVAGCSDDSPDPAPSSPTTAQSVHVPTVVTTQTIREFDPAVASSDAGAVVATAVFQRLLADVGGKDLKPDAATECLFRQATVYECTLRSNLSFQNGNALTSSDVKFSILRAVRLGQKGAAGELFSALQSIETPDDTTVQFKLKWTDNQFAQALATPAASLVDEATYPATAARSDDRLPIGSGPYRMTSHAESSVQFSSFGRYHGATPAHVSPLKIETLQDSGAVENAIISNTADVAWEGLSETAVTRLQQQIDNSNDETTSSGWSRVKQTGLLVRRLVWTTTSSQRLNAPLRNRVSLALQSERTLDSIVPAGVSGHASAFPQGGVATLPTMNTSGISLVISYTAGSPGAEEAADTIKKELQSKAGLKVSVSTDATSADIVLTDALPPMDTAIGWMLPYIINPLPGSAAKVAQLDQQVRTTNDNNTRDVALSELQQQAAADKVVIPVSQSDAGLFVASGMKITDNGFGPGGQLALWGLDR